MPSLFAGTTAQLEDVFVQNSLFPLVVGGETRRVESEPFIRLLDDPEDGAVEAEFGKVFVWTEHQLVLKILSQSFLGSQEGPAHA